MSKGLLNFAKLIAGVVIGGVLFLAIYLLFPDGGAYDDVLNIYNSMSGTAYKQGGSKKLTFVESYTKITGEVQLGEKLGYDESTLDDLLYKGTSELGVLEDKDFIECAKAVASTFKCHVGASDYVKGSKHTAFDMQYHEDLYIEKTPWDDLEPDEQAEWSIKPRSNYHNYCYAQANNTDYCYPYSNNGVISFKGRSCATLHRDCSCFVSAMIYLTGCGYNWVHYTSADILANKVGNQVKVTEDVTFADLRVGDILARSGHVAMIVKKDASKVYIADCGNSATYNPGTDKTFAEIEASQMNRIKLTAEQGYAYTHDLTQKVTEWHSSIKIWRLIGKDEK